MKITSRAELLEGFRVESAREAALRVISRRGLAGATMQAIADEAGVAKGTLYLYFKDREDLIERTAEFAFSKLLERLESTLSGRRPLPEQLRELIETKLDFFDQHREFFRMYLAMCHATREAHASDHGRRLSRPQYRRYLERLAGFLEGAMSRAEVKRIDPLRLALLFAEAVNAIILQRLSEQSPPAAAADVDWVVETLLYGISVKGRA
jgi:AcrR family transcriptional regulator